MNRDYLVNNQAIELLAVLSFCFQVCCASPGSQPFTNSKAENFLKLFREGKIFQFIVNAQINLETMTSFLHICVNL